MKANCDENISRQLIVNFNIVYVEKCNFNFNFLYLIIIFIYYNNNIRLLYFSYTRYDKCNNTATTLLKNFNALNFCEKKCILFRCINVHWCTLKFTNLYKNIYMQLENCQIRNIIYYSYLEKYVKYSTDYKALVAAAYIFIYK